MLLLLGAFTIIFITITIIIIIVHYYLGLDRYFSTFSNSLVQALKNRLHLFGLKFRNILTILLLFVGVTLRRKFDLCLPIFRDLFLLAILPKFLISFVVKKGEPFVLLKTWSLLMSIVFYPFFWGSNFCFYIEDSGDGQPGKFNWNRFEFWVTERCIERFVVVYWRSDCGQPWRDDLWSLLQFLLGTSSQYLHPVMNEHQNHPGI